MPLLYRIGGCHSVNQLCPTGVKSSFLTSGMCSRLSLSLRHAVRGMVKNDAIMQTKTIGRSAAPAADIKAWLAAKAQRFSTWYNSRSGFYSRLAGFDVTWKTAARVNLFTLLVIVTAVAAVHQPVVCAVSAACSVWVVYRLNADERKGGEA